MTATDQGFLLAVESVRASEAVNAMFTADLRANIDAAIALGDLPDVDSYLIRIRDTQHTPAPYNHFDGNPDAAADYELRQFTPAHHAEAISRMHTALNAGKIVLMDRVLLNAAGFLRKHGRTLDVASLLDRAERPWDLVVFLECPDEEIPERRAELHEQFLAAAASGRPDLVIVKYSTNHEDMCDRAWAAVRPQLLAWAQRVRPAGATALPWFNRQP